MSSLTRQIILYKKLLTLASYRRRAGVALLAYFGATASVGQLILWLAGVSGGAALTYTLIVLMPIGILFALRVSLPSAEYIFRHPMVGSTLRLSIGNLFDTVGAPIVITMNRYFDTLLPWVSSDSLISQLAQGPYAGKVEKLRSAILAELDCKGEEARAVGDIVRISHDGNSYLLLAVADRDEETRSTVAIDQVWTSLSRLWRFARQNNLTTLRVPIIGSGYARAHVGRMPMLIILLTSYLTSAMEKPICDLEIVLHPSDADPDILILAKNYCEILGYKGVDRRPFNEGDFEVATQNTQSTPESPISQ